MSDTEMRRLDSDDRVLATYRYILETFQHSGRVPTLSEMRRDLGIDERSIPGILRTLENHDAIRLDPVTSWIADAYPYSAVPTKHVVTLDTGVRVYCMCAIDCFYVPFLAASDIGIGSSCHYCGAAIEIRIQGQKATVVAPLSTVVWDSDAEYDCPCTNFFCCEEHLTLWRDHEPDEPGKACSIDGAMNRGREAASRISRLITA